MLSLLRRRPGFRRLWAAGAVSLCGDWLSFVAVSVLALTGGGGPLALALVFAAHTLPAAFLSPVAGAIVDRVDRRKVLVVADLLAAVVTAAMTVAAALGSVAVIGGLLLVRSAITSAVPPAESAALRRLVNEDELVGANAVLAATWSTAYVIGMALGGFAALLGATLALALDAASFAIAAGLHATLPPIPVEPPGPGDDPARSMRLHRVLRATPRDTIAALRVACGRRPLLRAVLGKTPMALAGGAGWITLNLLAAAVEPFGAAALSFGVLQAFRGAGTGIGPAATTWAVERGASERRLLHASRALMLAAIAWLAIARDPVSLAAAALLWGMGTGTNWVLSHVGIQRHASDRVIGRLAAFDELLASVAMAAGAVIGALVVERASLAAAALTGVGLGLAGQAVSALLVARVPVGEPAAAGASSRAHP